MSVTLINESECIGDSLATINDNFSNLSTLLSQLSSNMAKVPDYLEYAWVCAPNTAAQMIPAETITTLTIDTEVVDLGDHGSISSNQVTLVAGTYSYDAFAQFSENPYITTGVYGVCGLYNTSDSVYVSRRGLKNIPESGSNGQAYYGLWEMGGQFTISTPKSFDIRVLTHGACRNTNGWRSGVLTNATANADQRTTLKLWKLA